MTRRVIVSVLLLFVLLLSLFGSFFLVSASSTPTPVVTTDYVGTLNSMVHAGADAATMTITAPPFGGGVGTATGAVVNPANTTCPTGLPLGWGTVTPDALWLMLCGECLGSLTPRATGIATGTPVPCPTIMSGGTAVACSSTATPVVTGTATPPLGCAGMTMTAAPPGSTPYTTPTLSGVTISFVSSTKNTNNDCSGSYVEEAYLNGVEIDFNQNCSPGGVGNSLVDQTYHVAASAYTTFYLHAVIINALGGTDFDNVRIDQGVCNPCVSSATYDTTALDNEPPFGFGISSDLPVRSSSNGQFDGSIYILPQPFVPPPCLDATATPGIPGTSYCDSLYGGDSGFGYGGITLGPETCFDIGPITWSDFLPSFFSLIPVPNVPWVAHICLQDMDLGTVEVFGVYLNLTIAVVAMAVAAIILIAVHK